VLEILSDALEAGALVGGGRFRLERVLGEGGMGVVWAARETKSGRGVALKFLRAGRETEPRNQERFLREARAAMAIAHPNVARVEAVLETNAGVPFLVMELLEGESLRGLLERRGTLDLATCGRVLAPVAEALAAAHAKGIVHRDLKPENVFVLPNGEIRVLDFGIAKQLPRAGEDAPPSLTSTGAVLGTPVYMAPEQIFGDEDLDARADVWALGVMLYECLAGRRPTDAEGFGPILKRITTGPLEPLEHARPGVPRAVTSVVGRMLSRDRAARPPLQEVRALLVTMQEGVGAVEALAPGRGDGVASDAAAAAVAAATVTITSEGLRAPRPAYGGPDFAPDPLSTTAGVSAEPQAPGAAAGGAIRSPRRRAIAIAGALAAVVVLGGGAVAGARFALRARKNERTIGASDLVRSAGTARDRRDGPACLRDLDAYDEAAGDPLLSSRNPASSVASGRAMCMMLAGDCDGGKALYRAYAQAHAASLGDADPDTLLDTIVGQYCEGERMAPRDALLRATARLSSGKTFTAKECLADYATSKRLLPTVPVRGPTDALALAKARLGQDAATCLARAGDCDAARRTFHAEWPSSPSGEQDARSGLPPEVDAQIERDTLAAFVVETPCGHEP
jgi:hypothetical protein